MSYQHNKLKTRTISLTSIFLLIGILIFLNILSYRIFFRIDLTERKEYTVSDATKNLLGDLDDLINITAYFSKDLPPYHSSIRTQVQDTLAEYQAYSNNNLKIQYVDPGKDEELKMKLARMGIQEIPLVDIKRDKQVISMGYMGIAIQYGDKGEVIPFVPNISNLEYDLSSAILKVQETSDRVVMWIGEESNDRDANAYTFLHEELNKSYIVRPMLPDKLTEIPLRTTLLVVNGTQDLSPRVLYAIDQYMMQNGNVIFLTDGVKILQEQGLTAIQAEQSVHPLLESYGITVSDSLIADRRHAQAMFTSGQYRFSLPYPLWPMIGEKGFNQDVPSVSQLRSLVLPWTSPLKSELGISPGLEISDLVKTSEVSWLMKAPFDLNPQQNWDVTKDDLLQSVLAVECRGPLSSHFADKPIPDRPLEPGQSFSAPQQDDAEKIASTENARFAVIASTRFVNNQFLSLHPENLIFFQNLVDSMALGDHLIGIRSRIVTNRPLDFGTADENKMESIKTRHRVMGIALMPVAIIGFGLIRMVMRKRKKAIIQAESTGV